MPRFRILMLFLTGLFTAGCPAAARDQIRIVGSSTVYPFATTAAEQFGADGKFKTPIIESTGTGGGFKLFCTGTGEGYPDINDASRKILPSETELCQKNGITGVIEVPLGYDGIVIANATDAPRFRLTKKQLFLALARDVPDKEGKLVRNFYQSWHEIDAALPDQPIKVYGTPPTSGTRDAFSELVMEKGCEALPAFAETYKDEKARKKACGLLREDGSFVEAGENGNLIVQKLVSDKTALGILGYGFLSENSDKVQGSAIEGAEPTMENIESGRYSVSRRLYVYVKREQLGQVPGIPEFVRELVSDAAIGPNGYLTLKGLLPLHEAERGKVQALVRELKSN